MNKIKHRNIVHLYEFLESNNYYYLIIDYCNLGDLETFLENREGNRLPEDEAKIIVKQILNAFMELRKHKIMH